MKWSQSIVRRACLRDVRSVCARRYTILGSSEHESKFKPDLLDTPSSTNVKRVRDEKRRSTANKGADARIARLRENRLLAASFERHREKVVDLFANESNIEALFRSTKDIDGKKQSQYEETIPIIRGYHQLEQALGAKAGLSYPDFEARSSILLAATILTNTVLVEINLRRLFQSGELKLCSHNEFLFRNLIRDIHDESKKIEILKLLTPLYKKSGKTPETFDEFFSNLDPEAISSLLNHELKRTHSFTAIDVFRVYFQHFKSGQYLNYDHSDYVKSVQASNLVKFNSPQIDNGEFIKSFERAFDRYTTNTHSLRHLDLVLEVVESLLQPHKYTPDFGMFDSLARMFAEHNLLNYQSLIYQSLPSYKHRQTVLAAKNHQPAPILAFHIKNAVQQSPQLLSNLIMHQVASKNPAAFTQLLSILGLDEVNEHVKVLNSSYYSSLISKSRFTKNKHRHLGVFAPEFESSEPILMPLETIYHGIRGCIELHQYQYVDVLFNKLILHSVECKDQTPFAGIRVVVNFTPENLASMPYSLLVTQDITPQQFARKIFTKEMLKLLLRVSIESDDMGRIMWLIPYLDDYIETNIHKHMEKVANNQMESSPIDIELMREIFLALTTFGLEGKLMSYDSMLKFNNIDLGLNLSS